jgi:S-adenosylmethionine:tRNA ribosyltransferase-isomerase
VVEAQVTEITPEGGRVLKFDNQDIRDRLKEEGTVPLPPYIHNRLEDEERYQTVYSGPAGSAAAPTAGLHFSETMLAEIQKKGINIGKITLHVGIDTFRPVKEMDAEMHVMHGEWFTIPDETAEMVNQAKGRVIAVGTTCVRALESAAISPGIIRPVTMNTRLYILPGYKFQIVQAMLTNFHLPESTLLMLISAFAGREWILKAYEHAVKERYRFFSFGDAMLII